MQHGEATPRTLPRNMNYVSQTQSDHKSFKGSIIGFCCCCQRCYIYNSNFTILMSAKDVHRKILYHFEGQTMSVATAIQLGFLEKNRKYFCNPREQTRCTLLEAINNGWIHLKSNLNNPYDTKTGFSLNSELINYYLQHGDDNSNIQIVKFILYSSFRSRTYLSDNTVHRVPGLHY